MIELQGKFGKDCKIFANTIENEAIGTIQNILNNPVTTGVPVRVMPDTHQGVDMYNKMNFVALQAKSH